MSNILVDMLNHHIWKILYTLKADKSQFYAASASFLGYFMTREGTQMNPEKVSADTPWPSLNVS